MNPNYPNGPIGYGWGFGQNATTTSRWEQPQIGFCFDSQNPQIPEVCPPPIQNPGVIGFAYGQAVENPPLVSSVSPGRSQSNSSTDRTFDVTSPRLNVPPSIEAMRPKSYINYSDESFAPSAPPESISPHSESVKVITITRKDSKKSGYWSPCTPLVWNKRFSTPLGGISVSTNPVEVPDIRFSSSQFDKQHPVTKRQ
ncbi:unnamed protein product [Schistosoma curassoni]|uniref:Ovule protein n=1 Tax=Schistosoma curassoni TaxID=6186 RepID=A0A183JWQ7_9TREM|nr:unnamed protein product [Schistosoma curassoni]